MSSNSTGFWYNISSLSYSLLLINKLKGDIPLHVPNTIVLLQEKRNISEYKREGVSVRVLLNTHDGLSPIGMIQI